MKLTKEQHEYAQRMIEKEDLVLVCNHVLDKTVDAEYNESDDSYVCSICRDFHGKCGIHCSEQCMSHLSMVHRSCLGV